MMLLLISICLTDAKQRSNLPKQSDSTMNNRRSNPRWLIPEDEDDGDNDEDDYYGDDDEDDEENTTSSSPSAQPQVPTGPEKSSLDIPSSPTTAPTIRKTPTSPPTTKHTSSPTIKNKVIPRNTKAPTSNPTNSNHHSSTQKEEYYLDEEDDTSDQNEYETMMEEIKSKLTPDEAYYLSNYEFKEEEEEVAKISFIYFIITMILMVFTAHQLSEYPDGVYANMCRLTITIMGVFFKLLLFPFRKVCGFGSRTGYAHHLVTNQSEFRDPYANTAPNSRMEIL
jgi:hypothetical protein